MVFGSTSALALTCRDDEDVDIDPVPPLVGTVEATYFEHESVGDGGREVEKRL